VREQADARAAEQFRRAVEQLDAARLHCRGGHFFLPQITQITADNSPGSAELRDCAQLGRSGHLCETAGNIGLSFASKRRRRRRRERISAMFKTWAAKMKKQPDRFAASPQVVDKLRLIGGCDARAGLEFDNHVIIANKIDPVFRLQRLSAIKNREFHFATKGNPPRCQFSRQGSLVNGLQKSTTQPPMNLHRGADDRVRTRISFVRRCHEITLSAPNVGAATTFGARRSAQIGVICG